MHRHERPTPEALLGLVVWALGEQRATCSVRRDQIDMQIAPSRGGQGDLGLNVLEKADVRALGPELELDETFGWN